MNLRRRHALIAAALLCGLVPVPDAIARPKPDLRIAAVRATPVATPGGRIVIAVDVSNSGNARAGVSSVGLSFSRGRKLRRLPAPALGPGRSFFRRVTLTAPRRITSGRYAIVACADTLHRIAERSERNNCARTRTVSIAPVPAPPRILERPAELTNSTTTRFSFIGKGAFECRLDTPRFTPCKSPLDHGAVSEGAHRFQVRTRDGAGRRSRPATAAWLVDVTPPVPPTLAAAPPALSNQPAATFEFGVEPGAAAICSVDGAAVRSCPGRHTVTGLSEGAHVLRYLARDTAGNESGAVEFRWRIDLTPPPAPVIAGRPPAETYVRSAHFTFTFPVASEETTRACRVDAAAVPCSSPMSLPGPLSPGPHAVVLTARDAAGNEAVATAQWTILARADGIYGGPGGTAPVAAFEAWRGTPVRRVLEYLRIGTWTEIEADGSSDVVSRWRNSPYDLVLSTPMLPASGATLAQGALGIYNDHFRILGQKLVREGQEDAVIRLGWEFNGDWFPWGAGADPEAFKAYWIQIVTTMRAVAGSSFTFDWCPNSGPSRMRADLAYPGNGYVDYVGLSAFDASWGAPPNPTPAWRWGVIRDQPYGLAWQRDFAAAHGKHMTYPEWGLWKFTDPSYYAGGGSDGQDDPYYIERMFEWLNENEVVYALYFEHDSPVGLHRLNAPNFPNGAARYRALFGR